MNAPTPESLEQTPLAAEHVRLGGRMVPFAGYSLPVQYTGVTQEHVAVRTGVGVFDVSHMGRLELVGPNALTNVDRLMANAPATLAVGRGLYSCCCNEQGGVLDDLIVYRLEAERVLVVCNASNRRKIVQQLEQARGAGASLVDLTDATALIAVQGPSAANAIALLGGELSRALTSFGVVQERLAGVSCWVARTGYTGEDGFEVCCPAEHAIALWRALLEAGAVPAGLGARDTLRLEAGLPLYGNELDEQTNPFEAGIGWSVKLAGRSFVGSSALEQARREPSRRKLVAFIMRGRGVGRHGYPVLNPAGEVCGVCTSGAPSPTLKENIGMAYVPPALGQPGAALRIDCRGRTVDAEVVPKPCYRRARA
jgi:aminomethyltransferase